MFMFRIEMIVYMCWFLSKNECCKVLKSRMLNKIFFCLLKMLWLYGCYFVEVGPEFSCYV